MKYPVLKDKISNYFRIEHEELARDLKKSQLCVKKGLVLYFWKVQISLMYRTKLKCMWNKSDFQILENFEFPMSAMYRAKMSIVKFVKELTSLIH